MIEKGITLEDLDKLASECNRLYDEQQKEMAKLQDQLKNAIVPKFKMGQKVWFIAERKYRKVESLKIEDISISSFFTGRGIMYSGGDWSGISENELFATEAEAQKYLKEVKNG